MKFKLGILRVLDVSLKSLVKKEMPAAVSYQLAKFIKKMSEELIIVEEQRIKLVKKYSVAEDDTEQSTMVAPEHQEQFMKEFSDLLEQEVEIDFEPVKLSSLGDIVISPVDLVKLEKIIALDK